MRNAAICLCSVVSLSAVPVSWQVQDGARGETGFMPASKAGQRDTQTTACLTSVFSGYNKLNLAILLQNGPTMSVEATIAQRRLQEQYCLQVARCLAGDPSVRSIEYAVEFSSCLQDEALEKYEAVPRSEK
jgi:hypothetical protein